MSMTGNELWTQVVVVLMVIEDPPSICQISSCYRFVLAGKKDF